METMQIIERLGATDAERAAALLALPDNPGDVTAAAVTQWRKRGRPSWKWVAFMAANPPTPSQTDGAAA